MSETRWKRTRMHSLISLLVFSAELAIMLPSSGLAGDGDSSPDVRIDTVSGTEEGNVSLRNDALKLEAVLAYAQEHNPAIRAAQSRLLAAQKVPPQASA